MQCCKTISSKRSSSSCVRAQSAAPSQRTPDPPKGGNKGGKTKKKIILTDFSSSSGPTLFDSFPNSAVRAVFAFAETKQCWDPGWAEPNVSLRPSPGLDSVWPGFCLPSQLAPQPMRRQAGNRPMGSPHSQAETQAASA